jgi:hypothetical protein
MAQILAKFLLNIKCVFWFSLQNLSAIFLILIRIHWAAVIKLHRSSLLLSDFNDTWILLTDFWKILRYQISFKSIQWEHTCSIWTDRWMDRHNKANSHLLQFCKCAWKQWVVWYCWKTYTAFSDCHLSQDIRVQIH